MRRFTKPVSNFRFVQFFVIHPVYIYIYLGCDTTSAFYGKGKKKKWKLMVEKKMFDGFRQLGSCYFPSPKTFQHLEKFVCALYGQDGISQVNEA